jgi:hypothetical protein
MGLFDKKYMWYLLEPVFMQYCSELIDKARDAQFAGYEHHWHRLGLLNLNAAFTCLCGVQNVEYEKQPLHCSSF